MPCRFYNFYSILVVPSIKALASSIAKACATIINGREFGIDSCTCNRRFSPCEDDKRFHSFKTSQALSLRSPSPKATVDPRINHTNVLDNSVSAKLNNNIIQ